MRIRASDSRQPPNPRNGYGTGISTFLYVNTYSMWRVPRSFIAAYVVFYIELPRCATLDTWIQYLRNATLLAVLFEAPRRAAIDSTRPPVRRVDRPVRRAHMRYAAE